jgi:hypothetical protein
MGYTEDLVVSQDFVSDKELLLLMLMLELVWILLSLKLYLGTIMNMDIQVNWLTYIWIKIIII